MSTTGFPIGVSGEGEVVHTNTVCFVKAHDLSTLADAIDLMEKGDWVYKEMSVLNTDITPQFIAVLVPK